MPILISSPSVLHIDVLNHCTRGAFIRCKRDIIDIREPEQRRDIRFMRLRRQWIPEEDDYIYLLIRHHGTDLLIPAEGSGFEAVDGETRLFNQFLTSGAGGIQAMV